MKKLIKTTLALSLAGIVQMAYANTDSRPNARSSVYQSQGNEASYENLKNQGNSDTGFTNLNVRRQDYAE